ncbi:lipopolysaccharide biosynthesis protein, partial [uncultured Treponema sp.]
RKFPETHNKPLFDKELIKEMLKFVSMLLLTVFASLMNTQGVVMLINLFFGLTINAAYAVAVQVQNAVNTFVTNFKSSMVPQIMASYGANDLKSMHNLINFGTKLTFIMLLMITLPLITSIQWILTLWLKEPPEYSAQLVVLILISINISSYTYFQYQGVHASGKIIKQQAWTSSSYMFSILFVFIAFKLGFNFYYALFINMVVVGVGQAVINIIYAKKCYDYPIVNFIKRIFVPSVVIAGFVAVVVLVLIKTFDSEVMRLIVSFAIDLTLLPLADLFVLFSKEERQKVYVFVGKLVFRKA